MSTITKEIEIHENKISILKDKINDAIDANEKLLLYDKINLEQQFILTLYKIKWEDEISRSKSQDPIRRGKNTKNKINHEEIKDKKSKKARKNKSNKENKITNFEKELIIRLEKRNLILLKKN